MGTENPINAKEMTADGDFFTLTNFIYDHYHTAVSRLISMSTKILPKNENAHKTDHDSSEQSIKVDACCSTTYNAEVSSNLPTGHRSWRKFWVIFRATIKRINVAIKKIIRCRANVLKRRKLKSRSDHGGRAIDQRGSKVEPVAQEGVNERDWFRVQCDRRAGQTPTLASEECAPREHYGNSSETAPPSAINPVLNPLGIIKCTCPSIHCVCSGNKLRQKTAPRGLLFWMKSSFSKLLFGCKAPAEAALPTQQSIFTEKELSNYLQDKDLLKPRCPDFSLQGCGSFYYYDRSDLTIESPSSVKKEKVKQDVYAVNKGQWSPLSRPCTERNKEMLLKSDRVCSSYGKYSVSTQMHRGKNGKFIIPQPYIVMFGQPDTTILKDISGAKLSITLDTKASDRSAAGSSIFRSIVSNPAVKRYYNKLKKTYRSPMCVIERSNDTTMQTEEVPHCHTAADTEAGYLTAAHSLNLQFLDMCKRFSDATQRDKPLDNTPMTKEFATLYFFVNVFKLVYFLHNRYLDNMNEEAFDLVESLDDAELKRDQDHGDHREEASLPHIWEGLFI